MTQEQAISKGYTHFIEVWRNINSINGVNDCEYQPNNYRDVCELDFAIEFTKSCHSLYTVAIFLIKPKH